MGVRAKMICHSIEEKLNWSKEDATADVVKLRAVSDGSDENKAWAAATPQGSVELQIDNPDAVGQFEVGKSYYVTFTEAVEDQPDELGAVPAPVAPI